MKIIIGWTPGQLLVYLAVLAVIAGPFVYAAFQN